MKISSIVVEWVDSPHGFTTHGFHPMALPPATTCCTHCHLRPLQALQALHLLHGVAAKPSKSPSSAEASAKPVDVENCDVM